MEKGFSEMLFLSHLLLAGCDIGLQVSVGSSAHQSTINFCTAVIDGTVKHCILIVLGVFFKHNELGNKISNNVVYATSKASDQPAHPWVLIRAFASRLNIL